MTLSELRASFEAGSLNKQDFVAAAFQFHRHLFDYPAYLTGTNIASIEILEAGVAVRFRSPSIRMWCKPGEARHTALTCLDFRDYESQELGAMMRLADICLDGSKTFLDIGANVGFYSMAMAVAHPETAIHAFEPVPSTYAELQRNLALNGLGAVHTYNVGLSDLPGELTFFFDPSVSGATSSAPLGAGFTTSEVRCPVDTLDALTSRAGLSPDLIKCDVEGAELKVFLGARATLSRCRPIVFSEMLRKWSARFLYHPNDLIAFFAQLGYACYSIDGAKLASLATMTDDTSETNFFFLDRETHIPKAQAAGLIVD